MGASEFEHPDCKFCQNRYKSIFCDLRDEELSELNDTKGCTTYKKGQTIFHEGSRPQGIYCINSGKIKVFKTGEEGKEQIIHLAGEGAVMGYRALISGETLSCSATALAPASVCYIPKSVFFKILEENNDLSQQILKLLSNDLKEAERKITDLAQKPVRERLAEALLFLKETYGLENDKQTLAIVLTREDLANMVGTATETLIRLLSEFKKEKLIQLEGKRIMIIDHPKLVKAANVLDLYH